MPLRKTSRMLQARAAFSAFRLISALLVLAALAGALYSRYAMHDSTRRIAALNAEPTPTPSPTPIPQAGSLARMMTMLMTGSTGGANPEKGAPIPSGPTARTGRTVAREFGEWRRQRAQQCYKDICAARKTAPKPEILAYLGDICASRQSLAGAPDVDVLLQRGKALIDAGCQDPQVLEAYASSLYVNEKYDEAARLQDQCLAAMAAGGYPKVQIAMARSMRYRTEIRRDASTSQSVSDQRAAAMGALLDAIEVGDFPDKELFCTERLLLGILMQGDREKDLIELSNMVRTRPNLNPWFSHWVQGEARLIVAWNARGSGWASEVSEAGWKGFEANLLQARAHLAEAWKLRPDLPYPASTMISVAMGGAGAPGESVRTWFDRAVAAQMDYSDAYVSLKWALRPRWGGSHEAMLHLGEECLATGRFDTDVPWEYMNLLRDVAEEQPCDSWRSAFRQPGVRENLERLFAGYIKAHPQWAELYRKQQAVAAAWCGDYAKARELLAKLPPDATLEEECYDRWLTWGCSGRKALEAEIRACTGPDAEVLLKAEKLLGEQKFQEAANIFATALETAKDDPAVHGWIRDRLAYMMMSGAQEAMGSDSYKGDALNRAIELRYPPAVKFLVEQGADLNTTSTHGYTPLQTALIYNMEAEARLLVERGADPNRAAAKLNPLLVAMEKNMPRLALLLIEKGADPKLRYQDRYDPLYAAANQGELEIVKALLAKGAQPNVAESEQGWTPLLTAVARNNQEMVRLLLEKGADPNFTKLKGGYAPLHMATHRGNAEVVKLLLARGARLDLKMDNGQTALDVAREEKKQALIELLSAQPAR